MPPHSMNFCMTGAGLPWVGMVELSMPEPRSVPMELRECITTTTLAAAVASSTWGLAGIVLRGKIQRARKCSGRSRPIGGDYPRVRLRRSDGCDDHWHAAGAVPFFTCTKPSRGSYDDALETLEYTRSAERWARSDRHSGDVLGLNPNLALKSAAPLNAATQNGLAQMVGQTLWLEQLKAIAVTIALAVVA